MLGMWRGQYEARSAPDDHETPTVELTFATDILIGVVYWWYASTLSDLPTVCSDTESVNKLLSCLPLPSAQQGLSEACHSGIKKRLVPRLLSASIERIVGLVCSRFGFRLGGRVAKSWQSN